MFSYRELLEQPHMEQPILTDEPITLPSIERPQQMITDSGIHLPTPNLQAVDSAIVLSAHTDSQTIIRDQTIPPVEPVSSDTGIFKTPLPPPPYGVKQPQSSTFPSVDESLFQNKLRQRILDVSTPLTGLETSKNLPTRKTLLIQMENEGNLSGSRSDVPAEATTTATDTINIDTHEQQSNLQTIEEARESNIRPSTQMRISNGEANVQQTMVLEREPVEQINPLINDNILNEQAPPGAADDDYRRDWYEILRARLQNTNYGNSTLPQRKIKYRRPRRLQLQDEVEEPEPQQLPQPAAALPPQDNQSPEHLLQELFAGIVPPLTTNTSQQQQQNLNTTNSSSNSFAAGAEAMPLAPDISPEQQEYDQFIIDNADSFETIIQNLNSCRTMLEGHRRRTLKTHLKLNNPPKQEPPYEHFDPSVLLNADKERLAVKLGVIQNIIRQRSFDINKCDFIKDRMSAAIAFGFLLELKSAGLITLTADGRNVALR